jgi:NTE family protein
MAGSAGTGVAWIDEADGVFRGGGVKGLGIAGALEGFAADQDYPVRRWVNVAGASAGAIIASYLAVKGDDGVAALGKLLDEMPFASFEDFPPGGRLFGGVPNLFRRHGLARGEKFRTWFGDAIEHATFAAVKTDDGTDSRLKMVAVDVTNRQLLLLPDDLPRYRLPGEASAIDPDSFPIADAVRMSMSIPYFFEPVRLVRDQVRCTDPGHTELAAGAIVDRLAITQANAAERARGHEEASFEEIAKPQVAEIVDGGTLSNFPVWIFDVDPGEGGDAPQRLTFGFTLTGGRSGLKGHKWLRRLAPWPVRFGVEIFKAATDAWDNRFVSHSTEVRTITIDAGDVGTTQFDLNAVGRAALVERGRQAAARYLREFDPARLVNTHGARPAPLATPAPPRPAAAPTPMQAPPPPPPQPSPPAAA